MWHVRSVALIISQIIFSWWKPNREFSEKLLSVKISCPTVLQFRIVNESCLKTGVCNCVELYSPLTIKNIQYLMFFSVAKLFAWSITLASFPGSAQLSVTCSMVKQGEPGIFFTWAWRNQKIVKICRTNRLHFMYCSTNYTHNARCVRQLPPTS